MTLDIVQGWDVERLTPLFDDTPGPSGAHESACIVLFARPDEAIAFLGPFDMAAMSAAADRLLQRPKALCTVSFFSQRAAFRHELARRIGERAEEAAIGLRRLTEFGAPGHLDQLGGDNVCALILALQSPARAAPLLDLLRLETDEPPAFEIGRRLGVWLTRAELRGAAPDDLLEALIDRAPPAPDLLSGMWAGVAPLLTDGVAREIDKNGRAAPMTFGHRAAGRIGQRLAALRISPVTLRDRPARVEDVVAPEQRKAI